LSLGNPPPREPRALRIRAADIDVNAGYLEAVRGVERKDAAVGGFKLRVNHTANCGDGEEQTCWNCETASGHSDASFGDNGVEIQAACL
jgi:hypothetical protein